MSSGGTEGVLIEVDGRSALRFRRRYPQPVERVWRAVTDPAEMTAWFPTPVTGERAVGAELRFGDTGAAGADAEGADAAGADAEGADAAGADAVGADAAGADTDSTPATGRGVVTVFEPPRVFSFTWGGELLRLELTAEAGGTVLVFTHVLRHPSVAARTGAGWHMCLGALDQVLDTSAPAVVPWSEVYDDYLARVGPPLGVPAADGSMSWERATHVDADRVRAATTDPAEIESWGGAQRAGDPVRWSSVPAEPGTVFTLTHTRLAGDAAGAAAWHALLVQLDMYLASGRLVPVDPERWVPAYRELL
jgi:uncharacterized protein YndB with AHSA1/START domain